MSRSHNPSRASTTGLGWPDFARRYFRDRGCFLFLRVLRCFSSPGLPRACARSSVLRPMGLPHSEILGSQLVCSSPRLIAAYHVLHRLPVPRHPPCALTVGPPVSGPSGFHGVTGGVYKARERIHRGVADPRLLAIPASCRRVADDNPNLARLLAIGFPLRVRDALYQAL